MSVADQLRMDLTSTTLYRGELLPSEAELGARFGVSRITVRRALELLRNEGLVDSRQGLGWLVLQEPFKQVLGRFTTIEEQLEELGVTTRRCIVGSRTLRASGRLEEVLGGGELMEVTRINLADGQPFARVTVWVQAYLTRNFSLSDLEEHSFYALLSRSGTLRLPLARAVQNIAATLISEEDAELLKVSPGSPGLLCERITFDRADHPILFSRYVFPGSRAIFEVELSPQVNSIAPTGLRLLE